MDEEKVFGRYSGLIGLGAALAGMVLGQGTTISLWGKPMLDIGMLITNLLIKIYLGRFVLRRFSVWCLMLLSSVTFACLFGYAISALGWKPIMLFPFMLGELAVFYIIMKSISRGAKFLPPST